MTESVDVLPTICEFMGAEVPLQADGWSLAPFVRGEPAPAHWRDTAHFEWSFADPVGLQAETMFGIPMSHCSLAVARGPRHKYVQFAAAADVLPPLLFDLSADPEQTHNLLAEGGPEVTADGLGGDPGAPAVADAHGGADAERQLPPRRARAGRGPRHLAVTADPPRAEGVEC